MSTPNWDEYNNIRSNRNYYSEKVDFLAAAINAHSNRITLLKTAINSLECCVEELEGERNIVSNQPGIYDCVWTGEKATKYLGSCQSGGELYGNYSGFINSINLKIAAMKLEKTSLQREMENWQYWSNIFRQSYDYWNWMLDSFWSRL